MSKVIFSNKWIYGSKSHRLYTLILHQVIGLFLDYNLYHDSLSMHTLTALCVIIELRKCQHFIIQSKQLDIIITQEHKQVQNLDTKV